MHEGNKEQLKTPLHRQKCLQAAALTRSHQDDEATESRTTPAVSEGREVHPPSVHAATLSQGWSIIKALQTHCFQDKLLVIIYQCRILLKLSYWQCISFTKTISV